MQGAVAADQVQLAEQIGRLPGQQLTPDCLLSFGLPRAHAGSPV